MAGPSPLSRRAALRLFAGAPALAILPAAMVASADLDLRLDQDPIFAAIERHQAAEGAFTATLKPCR